ncbi:MAG: AAA family ATPase [Bacteroidales bacterium]|jgi:dephospho-CoA kinase|nr:AAA family ATPase [Bacteroidales bacterium]
MITIGITGTIGAGKGTLVDYLTSRKDFVHYSVRSFLIAELTNRQMLINRDTMTCLANELRKKYTSSYIIDCLFALAQTIGKNAVIESIRAIGEIESLRKKGNFYLLAIDANPAIRYKRIVCRRSETDHVSFEEFLQNEQREMTSTDANKQNISQCIALADYLLCNDGTRDELYKQLENILAKMN